MTDQTQFHLSGIFKIDALIAWFDKGEFIIKLMTILAALSQTVIYSTKIYI